VPELRVESSDVDESRLQAAIERIRKDFPKIQAVYIFGSVPQGRGIESSDVDIGLLLPHSVAKAAGLLAMSDTRFALEEILGRTVDLVNLRRTSIVLQKEALATGRRFFTGDRYRSEEYEMIVLSLYGKLNEERREILEDFYRTKRAYRV
jgi:uncharacterized protein